MANRFANLVGSNKIRDEYTKINGGFDAVAAELDAHYAAAGLHITVLPANSFDASATIDQYPIGVSVMRTTDSDAGFPNATGTVVTVRPTPTTGFQMFVSTTSNENTAFRGTASGVWKDWEVPWTTLKAPSTQSQTGYQVLPNGLVIQWGNSTVTGGSTIAFPLTFPNACFQVVVTLNQSAVEPISVTSVTASGFTVHHENANARYIRYIAIGN